MHSSNWLSFTGQVILSRHRVGPGAKPLRRPQFPRRERSHVYDVRATLTYGGFPMRCYQGRGNMGASISTRQQGSRCVRMETRTHDMALLSQQRPAEDRTRACLPLPVPVVPGVSRPPPPCDKKNRTMSFGFCHEKYSKICQGKTQGLRQSLVCPDTACPVATRGWPDRSHTSVVWWCMSRHVGVAVRTSMSIGMSMSAIEYTCRYLSNPRIPSNSINENQSVLLHN